MRCKAHKLWPTSKNLAFVRVLSIPKSHILEFALLSLFYCLVYLCWTYIRSQNLVEVTGEEKCALARATPKIHGLQKWARVLQMSKILINWKHGTVLCVTLNLVTFSCKNWIILWIKVAGGFCLYFRYKDAWSTSSNSRNDILYQCDWLNCGRIIFMNNVLKTKNHSCPIFTSLSQNLCLGVWTFLKVTWFPVHYVILSSPFFTIPHFSCNDLCHFRVTLMLFLKSLQFRKEVTNFNYNVWSKTPPVRIGSTLYLFTKICIWIITLV